MSTINVQNICETTNFFMNYFLSRTGVNYTAPAAGIDWKLAAGVRFFA